MDAILPHYERVNPTTWAYLSSVLTIALYFKFSRLWSVRNLDLFGLILLAPGLLFVIHGQEKQMVVNQQLGYIWLFTIGGLLLVRMLLDPMMVRRPLLEPNLSAGGLLFLGFALVVFLIANVVTPDPTKSLGSALPIVAAPAAAEESPAPAPESEPNGAAPSEQAEPLMLYGPGYPYWFEFWQLASTRWLFEGGQPHEYSQQQLVRLTTARTVAILSHLAIIFGMVVIGYRHFDNIKTGIAAAVLYLLLPYTTISTELDLVYHVLLGALLVWAIALYRRPLACGILMGLAIGSFYYPIFLLPLWISFYWQRGAVRFVIGVTLMLAVLVAILYFKPHGPNFLADVRQMFGWILPRLENVKGFWGLEDYNAPVFRLPVLAAFVIMCVVFAIWPAQKNLGTLMSCTAAVMLGTQFWHAREGGQLMAWYLPLMLLTIFRPNLEDRVALSVVGLWPFGKKKPPPVVEKRALA